MESSPHNSAGAAPGSPWTDRGSFVVIGASGGIGSAVTRDLVARGARVVAAGRDPDGLVGRDFGPSVRIAPCDATRPDDIAAILQLALDHGRGGLAGIALCVGSILLKPAHRTTDAEWNETLSVNLTTAFNVVRAAGNAMRRGGSVVFCSSAAAGIGLANHEAIAAAKAGIEGLVRSAAATYAGRGLRFNAVAPGLVRTDMSRMLTANASALDASRAMHALGRVGEPGDVASALVWLLDPTNDWISGHVLRVDGGLARLRPVPRV